VAAAATRKYRLILIDCQMPDMDGLAAAAEIRRHESPDNRTFIVALTADVSPEQRARCRDAGMDDFLAKPLRMQTLAELLNRQLRRSREPLPADPQPTPLPGDDIGASLGRLQADIGAEMTLVLVREYLAGADREIGNLSRAGQLDAAHVRRIAHRLLGGAPVLGLARFERTWAGLSNDEANGEPLVTPPVLHELREACGELAAWLESHQRTQHA
jgi:CheY-like chemotaxis protein